MADILGAGDMDMRVGEETNVHIQEFTVPFRYQVCFTEGVFRRDNRTFMLELTRLEPAKRHRHAVFVDEGVASAMPCLCADIASYADAWPNVLQLVAAPEIITGGEEIKNDPALVERLQHRMLELGMDRHSFVVGIGGGAFLDMIGYVAATTHRGLRMVRIPTTVLAQNDSGVGVKTGVNAYGSKNLLGVFAPPFSVINDSDFLETLNERDRRAGMAEAVKVALIRDGSFFATLEANADRLATFERSAVAHLIRRCAELHMRQIAFGGDPFEMGSARPLDFGHWSAHKLESLTNHEIRHGEAVAIGIALDTRYSVRKGLLAEGNDERVCRLLERLGFSLWHPALEDSNAEGKLSVMAGLEEFREHLGGQLTITLLTGIGTGHEVNEMDSGLIEECLNWLKERDAVSREPAL